MKRIVVQLLQGALPKFVSRLPLAPWSTTSDESSSHVLTKLTQDETLWKKTKLNDAIIIASIRFPGRGLLHPVNRPDPKSWAYMNLGDLDATTKTLSNFCARERSNVRYSTLGEGNSFAVLYWMDFLLDREQSCCDRREYNVEALYWPFTNVRGIN